LIQYFFKQTLYKDGSHPAFVLKDITELIDSPFYFMQYVGKLAWVLPIWHAIHCI